MRISKNKGSAGHKGVESIIKELGSKNFARLRIGIRNQKSKVESSEKFVLKNFTKKEEEIVGKIIKESCSALKMILSKGLEKAMNEFNKND
jgi:PTH1 family peptidyl-tRNA hydrolase